jgi:hypothetical protein
VRRAGKMVGNGSRAVLTRARQSVAALSATSARRGSSRGGGGRAWTRGQGQRRGKGGGAHAADEEENGRKRGMMAIG